VDAQLQVAESGGCVAGVNVPVILLGEALHHGAAYGLAAYVHGHKTGRVKRATAVAVYFLEDQAQHRCRYQRFVFFLMNLPSVGISALLLGRFTSSTTPTGLAVGAGGCAACGSCLHSKKELERLESWEVERLKGLE
jgi:hypothetical protein